jgi:signal transduction histidine kinase
MARFEVQARVIDLLGLQQIANCPTAISELFKNAWDAYAEKVMLDVYPDRDQAVLWDDGVGMTEEEVLHRWLVVGAAGKADLPASVDPPAGMTVRPIQGEKGIGRLAISTLGDTVLLITRSRRPQDSARPFVALLINWNIIHNEHLRLSDLEVPHFTFANLGDLESGIVHDMVADLRRALFSREQAYAWDGITDPAKRTRALDLRRHIVDQLQALKIDIAGVRQAERESSKEQGTIFCLFNLKPEFQKYVSRPKRDEEDDEPHNELVQLLSNFQNVFDSASEHLVTLVADIRRWDSQNRLLASLFEETTAFEPDDLRLYDHQIDVTFDHTGRFTGRLEIYGAPVALPDSDAQPTRSLSCGPFSLRLWYYQAKNQSRLDAEQWTAIDRKLRRFGGLMIYRDNLRVLPYGRPEFDWLRLEERRSKGAGYYFFSYRRMFGFVTITHHDNPQLLDKSGREGLISNAAYREFRQTLESFFLYISRQYFKKGTEFFDQKTQLTAERHRVEDERKRAADVRLALREEAAAKLTFLKDKAPEQMSLAFREGIENLDSMQRPEATDIADTLIRFENRIAQIEGTARLVIPRNISTRGDRQLTRLKHDHDVAFQEFSAARVALAHRFEDSVGERFPAALDVASRQRVHGQAYARALADIGKAYKALRDELDTQVQALALRLEELNTQLRGNVDQLFRTSEQGSGSSGLPEGKKLAGSVAEMAEAASASVAMLRQQQARLAAYLAGYFGDARDELLAAQTGEIEELREQVDRNLELVQLGLTVEIIDHDLNKLFLGIRATLARLLILLRSAPKAMRYLEDLRSSFHHLEQRFRQMSPIYRASYRIKSTIDGRRILAYCREFMGHELRTTGTSLEASASFAEFQIFEAEAVVLPVFVNLVDNAIYWLRGSTDKRVIFDRRGPVVTICDSGPGIHPTEFEEIFEPFVSNKPGGRGLGLYIARANLKRYGHEIWATDDPQYRVLPGACICIRFHPDVVGSE